MPEKLAALVAEIYAALDAGANRLAAMGVRTVVDMVALELVGDAGGFGKKLDALVGDGYIAGKDRERLSVVVGAGSAAAHRGAAFEYQQLAHMMETVEHLLKGLYAFKDDSKKLRGVTPKRRRTSSRGPKVKP